MNKRGQTRIPTATIVEFVILFTVIALMFMLVYKEGISTKYEKMFLSKDSAMFIEAIYASPNLVIARYPQKIYDFSFKFGDSIVTVYEKDIVLLGEKASYTETKNIKVMPIEDRPEDPFLLFTKDNKITPYYGKNE